MTPAKVNVLRRLFETARRTTAVALTWILLGAFYYLYFLPGRIVLLALRRDPLDRAFPSPRPSLWNPRPAKKGHNPRRMF